jgi:hypothetical protein
MLSARARREDAFGNGISGLCRKDQPELASVDSQLSRRDATAAEGSGSGTPGALTNQQFGACTGLNPAHT